MSERLTSPGTSSTTSWQELAIPGSLILVSLFTQKVDLKNSVGGGGPTSAVEISIFTGVAVLFALQCGAILRGMLPAKAPKSHKLLAATLGILASSVPIAFSGTEVLLPWALALAGWNFFHTSESRSVPAALLSGLCAGAACAYHLHTLLVAVALLVLNLLLLAKGSGSVWKQACVWVLGLVLGLSPFLLNTAMLPKTALQPPEVMMVLEVLALAFAEIGLITIPFLLLGTGVAFFQARTTVFALLLPLLLGLPLLMQVLGYTDHDSMVHLPLVLIGAYGLFRVCRGIEQGIRNSSAARAKAVIPLLTGLSLAGYAGWIALMTG